MNEKYIGYKIRLFPTEEQAKRLIEICHVFRFCYNWGLNYANTEYEKGNRTIPISHLIKLAKYYRTSVDYIVGLTDKKNINNKKTS